MDEEVREDRNVRHNRRKKLVLHRDKKVELQHYTEEEEGGKS